MRSQKGKILSWIIFIIIILIIFGLLLYLQSMKKAEKIIPPEKILEETKITKPRKTFAVTELTEDEKNNRDNDAFNQALLTGKGCEEIKYDEKLRQLCFDTLAYNEALSKNDETICETIVDSEMKTKCYDQIYLNLALSSLDAKLCDKIKDEKIKQNCKDQILAFSGVGIKSASDCTVIKDMTLKQMCLDNYYMQNSAANLDKTGCDKISDSDKKERCVSTVAQKIEIIEISKIQAVRTYQTAEETLKSCDSLSGDDADSCKNEANFNLALDNKDLSYCNKITDSGLQNNCVQTQSVSINSYYLKQAVRLKDKSLCDKILDATLRTTCQTSIQ